MFDSKSPIVKYTGYAIIGFFGLIIIISFGMPSFMPEITRDKNSIAVINGEKIKTHDFLRYRDSRNRNAKDDKEMDRLLDEYIQSRLLLQKAREMGFDASDSRVSTELKKIPFLQDKNGKFDPKKFSTYLGNMYLTMDKFYTLHKSDYIKRDFMDFIQIENKSHYQLKKVIKFLHDLQNNTPPVNIFSDNSSRSAASIPFVEIQKEHKFLVAKVLIAEQSYFY